MSEAYGGRRKRWKMEGGRRKEEDGRRRMEDGRRNMKDGRREEDGKLKMEGKGKHSFFIELMVH
jgi:hypothetical protein